MCGISRRQVQRRPRSAPSPARSVPPRASSPCRWRRVAPARWRPALLMRLAHGCGAGAAHGRDPAGPMHEVRRRNAPFCRRDTRCMQGTRACARLRLPRRRLGRRPWLTLRCAAAGPAFVVFAITLISGVIYTWSFLPRSKRPCADACCCLCAHGRC